MWGPIDYTSFTMQSDGKPVQPEGGSHHPGNGTCLVIHDAKNNPACLQVWIVPVLGQLDISSMCQAEELSIPLVAVLTQVIVHLSIVCSTSYPPPVPQHLGEHSITRGYWRRRLDLGWGIWQYCILTHIQWWNNTVVTCSKHAVYDYHIPSTFQSLKVALEC